MSVAEDLSRRRGGRDARRALRARPIPLEEAAVHPGMTGGQYKPLSERDVLRIHEAAWRSSRPSVSPKPFQAASRC